MIRQPRGWSQVRSDYAPVTLGDIKTAITTGGLAAGALLLFVRRGRSGLIKSVVASAVDLSPRFDLRVSLEVSPALRVYGTATMPFEVCLRSKDLIRERGRWLWAWMALLVCAVVCAPTGATQTHPSIFPVVSADALDKRRVTLPSGLEGQTNLLLLSFARDQANQIDTWSAVAQALQHTNVSFRAYRIPVEERENALFRWWANASLRSEETDPELWHWVVPIYVEKASFRTQLGIADEKSVVALLVDRSGRILWRATGVSSPQSRAALEAAASGVLMPAKGQ